jgi:predicted aspartyl protease
MSRTNGETMGRVKVEVDLVNYRDRVRAEEGDIPADRVRRAHAQGVVDTGATYLVLPQAMADQLGVPTTGKMKVRYADHRHGTRPVVEGVQVELLGRQGTFKAIVEPKRTEVLIGAIVLEDLDLLVDCTTQTLQPRDPKGMVTEIE